MILCVKTSLCQSLCVYKLFCVKLLCAKAALCKTRARDNSSAFSVPLPPSRALPKLFPHLSVHADAYPTSMLGFSFSLRRCQGSENQASTDRTPCKRTFSHASCPACPFAQRLDTVWEVFGTSFSGQSRWWNLSWKIRANSSALLVSLLANEAMHVPWHRVWKLWQILGAQFFGTIVLMELFVLKNPCKQLCIFSVTPCQRSYACPNAQRCKPKLFPAVSGFPSVHDVHASLSLPPNRHLPKLFPTFSHPPPCPPFHLASSQRTSPKAISHVFPSVHHVHASISLPSCISHLFPSVHHVHASVLLPPNGALPKLFPTFSHPSTMSTLPSRSLRTELSPSYQEPPVSLKFMPQYPFDT